MDVQFDSHVGSCCRARQFGVWLADGELPRLLRGSGSQLLRVLRHKLFGKLHRLLRHLQRCDGQLELPRLWRRVVLGRFLGQASCQPDGPPSLVQRLFR